MEDDFEKGFLYGWEAALRYIESRSGEKHSDLESHREKFNKELDDAMLMHFAG